MTISKITFHPEAAAEVEAAFTWYQARSVRAAGSFLKALEEGLEAIAASPERRFRRFDRAKICKSHVEL